MKQIVFLIFLGLCFTVFSCAHNPYENFQDIKVGEDKAEVLDKVGSPLRSRHINGKNIWTYRFYSKADDRLVYKDLILDNEKVLEIRNSKDADIREIEKKEKLVEQNLRESKTSPKALPKTDSSGFKPVESNE